MTDDPAAEEWHTGKVRFTSDTGEGGASEALVNPATGNSDWASKPYTVCRMPRAVCRMPCTV